MFEICGTSLKCRGFTLVELVSVIVILSIVAILGSSYVVSALRSYHDTQNRSNLINQSRQAIERMTRQIRGSLPHSLRVTNSDACLEFLPVAGGGNYTEDLPLQVGGGSGSNSFTQSPYRVDFGTGRFLSIGALDDSELYGSSPGSLATLLTTVSGAGTALTLTANKLWLRNSISRRLFLLDRPQAFCLVSGQLRFYDNQDITESSVDTSNAFQVLAANVSANGTAFVISSGVEERSIRVDFNLIFQEHSGPESITFNHQVSLRNVP